MPTLLHLGDDCRCSIAAIHDRGNLIDRLYRSCASQSCHLKGHLGDARREREREGERTPTLRMWRRGEELRQRKTIICLFMSFYTLCSNVFQPEARISLNPGLWRGSRSATDENQLHSCSSSKSRCRIEMPLQRNLVPLGTARIAAQASAAELSSLLRDSRLWTNGNGAGIIVLVR